MTALPTRASCALSASTSPAVHRQRKEIAGVTRSNELADQFVAAHEEFFELIKAASPEQWRVKGINHPKIRVGNEDEGRPVGVIVHHVASGYMSNRLRCI